MVQTVAVSDTSFVIALLNANDDYHNAAVEQYRHWEKLLLPQPTLTEIAYLLYREGGNFQVVKFLELLPSSTFELTELTQETTLRTAEILGRYADTRIDFVDACVMAIAESHNIKTILTLDRRDFSIVRPSHCEGFTLLP